MLYYQEEEIPSEFMKTLVLQREALRQSEQPYKQFIFFIVCSLNAT